jgi:hypothetical protein
MDEEDEEEKQKEQDADVMAVVLGVTFGKTSFECSTSQAHHAAAHGLCDMLHVLYEARSDLSQLHPRTGRSLLHVAVAKTQMDAVMKLLDLDADPWLEDDEGRTAVDLAAASEKVKTAFARESVLFIGTQFSILYTFMYSPA